MNQQVSSHFPQKYSLQTSKWVFFLNFIISGLTVCLLTLVTPQVLLAQSINLDKVRPSVLLAQNATNGNSSQTLRTKSLQIGLFMIQAELATDHESRSRGLMFRRELAVNQGMLFVFERLGVQCFWMKNTFIPLTAAFINDQGQIVNLVDMTPQSEASHCSKEPVRYVLEMNQGWFKQRGIEAGATIRGISVTK